MINSSFSKKLMLLTLLTSVATLTACGNKDAKTVPSGSSSSVAAKVTDKSSSVAATVASQTSSTETQVEETSTEAGSEEAVTEEKVAPVTTSLDINGLAAGDYSSIAGTWANGKGQVFTVTAEGILYFSEASDENSHHKIETASLDEGGRVGGSLGFYNNGERQGGAGISIVPAGVENNLGEVADVDHIEIGQSANAANPDEQFFRQ